MCLGFADLIVWRLLDIAEDRPLGRVLVLLQTDTICSARDNEIIDLCKGREFVLEGIIS
jgi:hypothetical protein